MDTTIVQVCNFNHNSKIQLDFTTNSIRAFPDFATSPVFKNPNKSKITKKKTKSHFDL